LSIDTSRRGFLAITGAGALAAPALPSSTLNAATLPDMLTVEDLQADCLSEPRALHNQTLRLSWRLRSPARRDPAKLPHRRRQHPQSRPRGPLRPVGQRHHRQPPDPRHPLWRRAAALTATLLLDRHRPR
jgi:hypothetical protein